MSLNKERLKQKIKQACQQEQHETSDADASLERISQAIASAVIDEIQNIRITYTGGLVAPNGAVTGSLTYTIS